MAKKSKVFKGVEAVINGLIHDREQLNFNYAACEKMGYMYQALFCAELKKYLSKVIDSLEATLKNGGKNEEI